MAAEKAAQGLCIALWQSSSKNLTSCTGAKHSEVHIYIYDLCIQMSIHCLKCVYLRQDIYRLLMARVAVGLRLAPFRRSVIPWLSAVESWMCRGFPLVCIPVLACAWDFTITRTWPTTGGFCLYRLPVFCIWPCKKMRLTPQ